MRLFRQGNKVFFLEDSSFAGRDYPNAIVSCRFDEATGQIHFVNSQNDIPLKDHKGKTIVKHFGDIKDADGNAYGNNLQDTIIALASITNFSMVSNGGNGSPTVWGSIGGTIANQTDLNNALNSKATPSDITQAINALVNSSPATLDTINEIAEALGNDPNFATTMLTALGLREILSNKVGSLVSPNTTTYPTTRAVVNALPNFIVVKSLADLPTPVDSLIQLANNKTYLFQGLVNIADNTLVAGVSNTILGFDKSDDGIIYTGADVATLCTNQTISINNITISAPNGSIFEVSNTLSNSCQIRECILAGLNLGVIAGGNIVAFNNNIVGNIGNLEFTGSINRLAIANNFFLGTTNLIRQVYLHNLIVGIVKIVDNDFTVDSEKVGIEANVVTLVSSGQITSNGFSGAGQYLKGIENDSLLWELEANGSKIVPTSAGYNPNNIEVFRDDFIVGSNETGEIGHLNWGFTNGQALLLSAIAGHCGIFRRVATTDNQITSFYLGTASGYLPFQVQDFISFIYIFRVTDLSNQFSLQLGVSADFGTNTPVNGVYFRKGSAENNFFAVCRAGSLETAVDTGTTYVQNQWYKFEVINDKINNQVIYKINNVTVATISTNIPSPTSGVNIGGNFVRLLGANRNLDIDYSAFIIQTTTR